MLYQLKSPRSLALLAVAFHAGLWILAPSFLFGNLHSDTLEAAYWAQHFAFGYSKHPPLTTWLINSVLQLPLNPLAAIMLLSQICVAVTAVYIWKAVRLFHDEFAAFCGVFLYLVSPISTFYAVQFNHNSMLALFYTAVLFYGLRLLRVPMWRDAVALGVMAGLGFLAKYEIIFALMTLFCMALVFPAYRHVFRRPQAYVSVVIFLLVISPHIFWLIQHNFPSIGRAVGEKHIHNVSDLIYSLFNLVIGIALMMLGVMFILPFDGALYRPVRDFFKRPHVSEEALLILVPCALLAAGGLVTWQVFKPLWTLSLTPSVVIGIAASVPWRSLRFSYHLDGGHVVKRVAVPLVLFFSYLSILNLFEVPLTAYSADSRSVLEKARALWVKNSDRPLSCVAVNEQKIGAAAYMWSRGKIKILHPASTSLDEEKISEKCNNTGAIAVFDLNETQSTALFPQSCFGPRHDFYVSDMTGLIQRQWHYTLFYISPRGRMDDHSCHE